MTAQDIAELGNLIHDIIYALGKRKTKIRSDLLIKGTTVLTWQKEYLYKSMLLPEGWNIQEINLIDNILGITLDNGVEHSFVIDKPGGKEQLQELLKKSGARQWDMLKKPYELKLNWKLLKALYFDLVIEDYVIIHNQILKQLESDIIDLLENHPDIDAINIIDAGCGQSPELIVRAQEIIKKHAGPSVTVKALAFEYEPENVEVCRNKMWDTPDVKIIQGDFNRIEHIIKEEKHLSHSPHTHNIVLSSGSITRMTLHHAFEALNVLQSSWRSPASKMVIGGEQDLLFVESMLKRIGFSIKKYVAMPSRESRFTPQPVLSLERIPLKIMVSNTIEQMRIHLKKPQFAKEFVLPLDLSMHPSPERMLQEIAEQAPHLARDITSLDLSFCCVDALTADSFRDYPSLREIKFTSQDPVTIGKLLAIISPTIELKIKYTTDEFLLFDSEKNLRRIGHGEFVDARSGSFESVNVMANYIHSLLPDNKKQWLLVYDYFLKKMNDNPFLFRDELSLDKLLKTLSHLASYEKNAEMVTVFNTLKIPALAMGAYEKEFKKAKADHIQHNTLLSSIEEIRISLELVIRSIQKKAEAAEKISLKTIPILQNLQKINEILRNIPSRHLTLSDIDFLQNEKTIKSFNWLDELYQEEKSSNVKLFHAEINNPRFPDWIWSNKKNSLSLQLLPREPTISDAKPNQVYVYLDKDKNVCYSSMKLKGRLEGSTYHELASMLRYLLTSNPLPITYNMNHLFLTATSETKTNGASLRTPVPDESTVESLFHFFIEKGVLPSTPKSSFLTEIIEKIKMDLPKLADVPEEKNVTKKESKEEKQSTFFNQPSSSVSSNASCSSKSLNKKK